MTVFDKFRNCITEPRCRGCEGIPGVCEYDHQSVKIPKALALDVLELLKEQEPVSPIRMHHTEHKQTDNYRCGKCGDDMYFEQRFCEFCGQAAKWD